MIINKVNADTIDKKEVYIHDDILLDMKFNRINKELTLIFEKYASEEKAYCIRFFGVVGFTMTSADFWGESECVFDFEIVSDTEKIIIPEILKKHREYSEQFCDVKYENYIEVILTFSSGDTLRIACEAIEIA